MAIVTIVVCALLILLVDGYIFMDVRKYAVKCHRKLYIALYLLFTLLCWGLCIAIICFPIRDANRSILPVMWMLMVLISIYVPKIVYILCSLIGRIFARKGRHNKGIPVGACLAFIAFLIVWSGIFYTPKRIVTNHVEIVSDRLPPAFDGMRAIQFSDAHLGTFGNDTSFVSQVVDSINALKPDVVFFTGDIVSRRSNELDPFVKVLRRIHAPMGVWAVHGNHDYASYVDWKTNDPLAANHDVGRLDSLMTLMNWRVLNNAAGFIKQGNDSIAVIGVENWGEPPFDQLGILGVSYPEKQLNDSNFKILMTHNPNHWSEVVKEISNIDLTLSGHTHAMQFMIGSGDHKWSPSSLRYPLWGGLYKHTAKDGTPMNLYVNIGIGEVGYPARWGTAYPELTLFTLKRPGK